MAVGDGRTEYITKDLDVKIGWAVSPIIAKEDIEANEYSAAIKLEYSVIAVALSLLVSSLL